MQVDGNFASENWIVFLPADTAVYRQHMVEMGTEGSFSELQTRKWTERTLVLARVWWACDHCTVHYWHNCIYSAEWSIQLFPSQCQCLKFWPHQKVPLGTHISLRRNTAILIITPKSSSGAQLRCIFYHLVLINLCMAPCLPYKGFLL